MIYYRNVITRMNFRCIMSLADIIEHAITTIGLNDPEWEMTTPIDIQHRLRATLVDRNMRGVYSIPLPTIQREWYWKDGKPAEVDIDKPRGRKIFRITESQRYAKWSPQAPSQITLSAMIRGKPIKENSRYIRKDRLESTEYLFESAGTNNCWYAKDCKRDNYGNPLERLKYVSGGVINPYSSVYAATHSYLHILMDHAELFESERVRNSKTLDPEQKEAFETFKAQRALRTPPDSLYGQILLPPQRMKEQ
jgi:hypothetical protein